MFVNTEMQQLVETSCVYESVSEGATYHNRVRFLPGVLYEWICSRFCPWPAITEIPQKRRTMFFFR